MSSCRLFSEIRTRLRVSRGLSEGDARRVMAAQMPTERKRDRSDFVIENHGSLAELEGRARWVFQELRRRAAAGPPAGAVLLLASADARDERPEFAAVAARYAEAGVRVEHARARGLPARVAALQPAVTLASARAESFARRAWEAAGRPGVLTYLTADPDPVAVRLDLRPWGGSRVAVTEEGATGDRPRTDLFPLPNPFP